MARRRKKAPYGYVSLNGNPKPHRFIVRRKGFRTWTRCFADFDTGKRQALAHIRSIEETGLPSTFGARQDVLVRQLVSGT